MHLSSAIPWGGTPGKGGDFVKDPVKVLIFPLLGGDTEESKFPSLRGITLSSLKLDKEFTWKGKNKRLTLVNCLPLSYLKKAIAEITRWKWIYITIPAPSAEVAITNTRRKVDHVLLHSGLHVYSFKTTWNWPVSFAKSPVFPAVQGFWKTNLPHFPRLQGKLIVQISV